jgi:peptide/nickel transport system substrate-binding protein
LGILAEANKELAFSSGKADELKVEWMSFIAGPSLEILKRHLTEALEKGFIPYENTLGKYITAEEAKARYEALESWHQQRGHFWVGHGPFYLHEVRPVEKIVVIRRYEEYPDPADKWVRFTEPRIAEVEVSGPDRVTIGSEAEFQVEVSFKGDPYPLEDVDFVKFLVFDARGELALVGDAEAVKDGLWRVVLTPEQTKLLEAGANRLEVVVSPKVVSIPTFTAFTFVTAGP